MTRRKEELKPIEDGILKIYVCGPTVYNFFHIGNARPFVVFDTLRKYLEYRGYKVKFVQNFTDVDDKIINKAREEGVTAPEISEKYIKEYYKDAAALNVRKADVHPKVSEHIPEIIDFVSTLVDKGYAYEVNGDVYFSTRKFDGYGKLSGQNIEDLESGARIAVGDIKQDPLDFALWKARKEDDEIAWESPWGMGRPGWHIECSAMSKKHLGDTIDIHAGGQDLQFPHHENEIAQSESYLGHAWCPQWFHVHHLNTSTGKMSKSKGEFLTVSLLEEKGYDPLVYRFFCLQSHYRKALVFTWENLDNAKIAYDKLIARIAALDPKDGPAEEASMTALKEKFQKALDADLNTSLAITTLYDVLKADMHDAAKLALLDSFDQVLGLALLSHAEAKRKEAAKTTSASTASGYQITGEGDPEIDALVLKRYEAKKAKNFAEADKIRDDLKAQGIEVTDVRGGAVWKRI